jgi:hypothetical protein
MLTRAAVIALSCGALVVGCATPESGDAGETQEIVDNLVRAGFPVSDITVLDGVVYVGQDAAVSLETSREMLAADDLESREQYRTTNLVNLSLATICVDGSKLRDASFSAALDNAIANYNDLRLTFRMQRTSGNAPGCNALISIRVSGPTGGSAGFPSGGLPFNSVKIGSGLKSFSVNTITHVITHELGHCVGLRHSDFFNRSISCGSGGNEGDGGIGAIHIPGTPTGATLGGSVMNSCFRSVESGEFTNTDVTALQTLY